MSKKDTSLKKRCLNKSAALFLSIAFCLFLGGECGKKYTRHDPVLEKPVNELTDEDLARMVVTVETNYGRFRIQLHPEWAPKTCRHFVKLVKGAFYMGLTFHEVRKGFWIVGGDPTGTGNGGLEFKVPLESPSGPHVRGAVGLYHPRINPEASGSQFYIMLTDYRGMDGKYTVFGKVIEGMSTVDRIAELPTTLPGSKPRPFMPLSKVVIEDIYLEAIRK